MYMPGYWLMPMLTALLSWQNHEWMSAGHGKGNIANPLPKLLVLEHRLQPDCGSGFNQPLHTHAGLSVGAGVSPTTSNPMTQSPPSTNIDQPGATGALGQSSASVLPEAEAGSSVAPAVAPTVASTYGVTNVAAGT